MEIRRTANAGVLLKLDDIHILLDGVCQGIFPYLATPQQERVNLSNPWPDIVAFTHDHDDHWDAPYAQAYSKATGREVVRQAASVGNVKLTAVPTRHMGRSGLTTKHVSFVITGSKCVWFMGDAAPTQLKELSDYPKPDVLMVPYPYVSTPAACKLLEAYLPCKILLLHLPSQTCDPEGLWQVIAPGLEQLKQYIVLPEMGETITL